MLARRVLLVGLAGLLYLGGSAQAASLDPRSAPMYRAIYEAVEGASLDEVIQWSDTQFARAAQSAKYWRYVRWGGSIILGATLVYTALDWLYNQAKLTTGTSLDDWMLGSPSPVVDWEYLILDYWKTPDSSGFLKYTCISRGYDIWQNRWREWACPSGSAYRSDWTGLDVLKVLEQDVLAQYNESRPGQWIEGVDVQRVDGSITQNVPAVWIPVAKPPLPDYIRDHPDAADGVKQAVTLYMDEQASQGNVPQKLDQPLPGITLDPAPTINQYWDDPYRDPLADSDGDSWPDWIELKLGSDPSNAGSQPIATADPDGDGYDNRTEADAGTDPTDPASRPGVTADVDTDGDGIKDSADPCPSDASNTCDAAEAENVPDPSMPTLQPVAQPTLSVPTPSDLPDVQGPFADVVTNFEQRLQTLWDTLQTRFPFGLRDWIPSPVTPSGECDLTWGVQLPPIAPGQDPIDVTVDVCSTPVINSPALKAVRNVVLASLAVSFAFNVLRRASSA